MKFKKRKLANSLSQLLLDAVDDAIATKKLPGFKLDMSDWVYKGTGTKAACHVCMAGACMIQRLGTKSTDAHPEDLGNDRDTDKLYAVNELREGNIAAANEQLGCPYNSQSANVASAMNNARELIKADFSNSRDNGRANWSTYRKAAKILAEAGL